MSIIPLFKVFMHPDTGPKVQETMMSGSITQGKKVEEFEAELAQYLQNPHVLTLNSATAGLTLALRLLEKADDRFNWPGFGPSDIVLTPALTCFATTAAILANRATIRWIDVDPNTANVNIEDIRRKLSPHTKVIYVVHWGGTPVDLDALEELQEYSYRTFGFRPMIVEDCAHAFGAEFGGYRIGSAEHGNICVFSLQAIKHLTTGDGGIITFPNEWLYARGKLLRWYGIDREKRNYKGTDLRLEHDISEYGYKAHMNDINATMGLGNLPYIPDILTKDRANATYYTSQLFQNPIPGITLLTVPEKANSAWWLYTIKVTNKDAFIAHMKEKGIMTSQVHNRNDIHSCVASFQESLPNLDEFEKHLVCIPVGWWITREQQDYIIASMRSFFR